MADLTSKRYLGEEGIKQIGKNIKGGNSLSGSTGYTVTDSVDYPLMGLKVFGKSEQKQYSGKNLLNYNNLSITSGIGAKNVNSEGIISAIDKNSDSRIWDYNSSDYYINLDKGSYIVTVIVTAITNSKNSGIQIRTSNNNVLYAAGSGGNQGIGDISFLTKGAKTAKFTLNEPTAIGIMAKLYEAEIKIQFELGDTTTSYEPYVGGIPSPNPDYPQEITSVVEPTVTVCGKNLINAMYKTTTKGGITCTNNGNGTYTLNGTATSEAVFTIVSRLDISGTYRIIGCPPNGSNGTYNISVNVDGAWSVNNYDIGNGSTINPSNYIIIAIAVRNGVTCNNLVFKPMLTTDLTATYNDFEQHKENTLSLPDTLNAIPVSSGGNVTIDGQEYIADYVDFERGVKVQRVGVVDLGTLTWNKSGTNTTDIYRMVSGNINNIKKPSNSSVVSNLLCTTYQSVSPNNTYDKVGGITISTSGSLYIYDANYNQSDSVEEFKSSVQGQMLYYEVEEPIETPIPESELQAYRQLHTYNGVTNISNDKGAGIEVNYCTSKMLAEYALPLIKDLEAENAKKDEEISALKTDILTNEKIHNRIYEGINLAEKFASEIAAAPYNGNPWAWIKTRITAEDFTGIRVGDYIPFTTTNGVTLNAQIAGINTYKNYGDTPVGSHIDFICKKLWPTLHPVNKVKYNNGTESQPCPWLASDLYLYLNSLSGSVPNSETVNPETVDVDYTADGVYYYLPEALKNVIKEKRFLLPKRYSASGLLTDDNQWGWVNIGKLWLPDECEVYGTPIWGGKGFSAGGSGLQYPLFAGNMNRIKFRNSDRYYWWLLSPHSSSSSYWCSVYSDGCCCYNGASDGYVAAPVCFRV